MPPVVVAAAVGAGVAGAASIASSAVQSKSIEESNIANIEQSQKQMDTEINLANTAHQREVADLRAAGLNPILSANKGAAVPTYDLPKILPKWNLESLPGAVSSALGNASSLSISNIERRKSMAEIELINANISNAKAEADRIKAEAKEHSNIARQERVKAESMESGLKARAVMNPLRQIISTFFGRGGD